MYFKRNHREQLAIAACLNATSFVGGPSDPASLKQQLIHELTDYFALSPEAQQFDREATMRFLTSLDPQEIGYLLHDMGKSPFESRMDRSGEMWDQFVKQHMQAA